MLSCPPGWPAPPSLPSSPTLPSPAPPPCFENRPRALNKKDWWHTMRSSMLRASRVVCVRGWLHACGSTTRAGTCLPGLPPLKLCGLTGRRRLAGFWFDLALPVPPSCGNGFADRVCLESIAQRAGRQRECYVRPSARLRFGRERVCFALLRDTFYIRRLLFHRYGIVRIAMNRHCTRFLPLSHAESAYVGAHSVGRGERRGGGGGDRSVRPPVGR